MSVIWKWSKGDINSNNDIQAGDGNGKGNMKGKANKNKMF